ncbi:MAG TPA: hypothetical protein VD962_03845 [Rubricoccaceae bacterium]|nr:hypothetical protein [Rubricoccaceae bacterium]
MPALPSPSALLREPLRVLLRHRGFSIEVRPCHGRFGDGSVGYTIAHQGLPLHRSGGQFGTAAHAERAARRFIDDALTVFERTDAALAC